jgi:hypothetical protein
MLLTCSVENVGSCENFKCFRNFRKNSLTFVRNAKQDTHMGGKMCAKKSLASKEQRKKYFEFLPTVLRTCFFGRWSMRYVRDHAVRFMVGKEHTCLDKILVV